VPSFINLTSRLLLALTGAALGLTFLAPAASAAPSDQHGGNPTAACNGTHHSDSGHGANVRGAYDETCDGSPSGNGNGGGLATGKPCAGCVGNADDKNPPGQASDGGDHNAGYECDRNHGVGRTNPAHTGCRSGETTSTDVAGAGAAVQGTTRRVAPGTVGRLGTGAVPNAAVEPPSVPPAVDAAPAPTSEGTAVLGVDIVREPAGGELARVAAAAVAADEAAASELPRTGGDGPDLLTVGLGLVALGTVLRRAGRLHR